MNWSPSLVNPYRQIGHTGLESVLAEQRAGRDDEPIVLALHLASPRVAYTDKAKSALALPASVSTQLLETVTNVTKAWAKVRKAEERDATRWVRRQELLSRRRKESQKDVVFEVIPAAYMKASDNDSLWTTATNVMYAARNEIQTRTDKQLDRQYFNGGYFHSSWPSIRSKPPRGRSPTTTEGISESRIPDTRSASERSPSTIIFANFMTPSCRRRVLRRLMS